MIGKVQNCYDLLVGAGLATQKQRRDMWAPGAAQPGGTDTVKAEERAHQPAPPTQGLAHFDPRLYQTAHGDYRMQPGGAHADPRSAVHPAGACAWGQVQQQLLYL